MHRQVAAKYLHSECPRRYLSQRAYVMNLARVLIANKLHFEIYFTVTKTF